MEEELVSIQENEYKELLQRAVAVIENARTSIAHHVATTASNTYWEIGKILHEKKLESKHGSGVVKRLSVDLKERYPDMGMSPRNLWYMKTFYERYNSCDAKVQHAVALLPWSHNVLILSKDLVGRAIESCKTLGINVDDHFREVTKMVLLGSGSKREVQDFMLTRYACYLVDSLPSK